MEHSLTVELGTRAYDIHFGAGAVGKLRTEMDEWRVAGRRVAVVIDARVAAVRAAAVDAMVGEAPRLAVAAGEGSKSPGELARVWDFLAAERLDRTSVVVAVGGGVVGDLAGFAAASYLRGVAYVQVPTTLLAMVDSAVGGKTGLNLAAGKNLVGAFHQPQAVYVVPDLLATLPAREFAAGMAEVLKYGLLGDVGLWRELVAVPLVPGDVRVAEVVRRCCAAKARVVAEDEFESAKEGGRALLNLGHTFGHAVEQVTGYGAYLHGEAVAVGLVAATRLSVARGELAASAINEVEAGVAAHGLPVRLREPLAIEALMAAMAHDKKVRAGRLRFVLLRALGEAVMVDDVKAAVVEQVWRAVGAG